MPPDLLAHWITSCLLLGLRIAPVFAFAPPFNLVQIPMLFRVLLGLGISVCLVAAFPQATALADYGLYNLCLAAVREAMLGTMFVLAFQLAFGALYLAGRTIDIQAGYGLALLIDPATRSQTPLVGTLFAYAAAAVFYSFDGHIQLLRILAASLDAIPLGSWVLPASIDRVAAFAGIVFVAAFGVAGAAILAMFLIDLSIAMLSRTVPQMNVLILGFQVKTIVLLLVLPLCFGMGGALLARMMAQTLQSIPRLL
jgi:flagellar biosynthesis protein FliR